jgi:hypothetical protein
LVISRYNDKGERKKEEGIMSENRIFKVMIQNKCPQ